ncbi:MAG TPA: hypothetical protein VGV06_09360 [Methylomirabilota bacterium]|nr:hypothetical protein [Methylomirabilota bacterium]
MRKLIAIGVLVGGLLAVAAPATAQFADPLSLAASGVLMPYFGGGGNLSLLEVASPAGPNAGLHMLFFNETCTRIFDSVGLGETDNDIAHFDTATINPGGSGLIAIAAADPTGFSLVPLISPIHARVYWITPPGRSRVLEPITVDTFGITGGTIWNPLRTAATFFAPPEGGLITTTVYFICPRTTIQGAVGDAFPTTLFPTIAPAFTVGASNLRVRIYNTNEVFLRDAKTTCDCLTTKNVLAISNVYGVLPDAQFGTYTEIEADNITAPVADHAFTGYRSIQVTGGANIDFFGRLSNGNRGVIQGGPGAANPASGR